MKVEIATKVSEVLSLRDAADDFFNFIESVPGKTVTVSFSKVSFMSRSFAHQYLTRKKQTKKQITETHVPQNVRKMFEVVQKPGPKTPLPKPTLRVIDNVDSTFF